MSLSTFNAQPSTPGKAKRRPVMIGAHPKRAFPMKRKLRHPLPTVREVAAGFDHFTSKRQRTHLVRNISFQD